MNFVRCIFDKDGNKIPYAIYDDDFVMMMPEGFELVKKKKIVKPIQRKTRTQVLSIGQSNLKGQKPRKKSGCGRVGKGFRNPYEGVSAKKLHFASRFNTVK